MRKQKYKHSERKYNILEVPNDIHVIKTCKWSFACRQNLQDLLFEWLLIRNPHTQTIGSSITTGVDRAKDRPVQTPKFALHFRLDPVCIRGNGDEFDVCFFNYVLKNVKP